MDDAHLSSLYFDWLVEQVLPEEVESYSRLLRLLYDWTFRYTIPNDVNRAEDGIDLRYHFGESFDIPAARVCCVLDCRPCSMLEMMVALTLRLSKQIFESQNEETEASDIFVFMLKSLGIYRYSDDIFDYKSVSRILRAFGNREFQPDGRGSLFYIPGCQADLRTVEIWYQMMFYLNLKCKRTIKSFLTAD